MPDLVPLIILDDPFDTGRLERQTTQVPVGAFLSEVLPERVQRDINWIVLENGRVLSREEWAAHCLQPHSEILCYPRLHDAVVRIAIGALLVAGSFFVDPTGSVAMGLLQTGLFMTGVGLTLGGAAALLFPIQPPQLTASGKGDSATYGFGGIRNGTRIGAPIPVVYGTHSVFFPVEAFARLGRTVYG